MNFSPEFGKQPLRDSIDVTNSRSATNQQSSSSTATTCHDDFEGYSVHSRRLGPSSWKIHHTYSRYDLLTTELRPMILTRLSIIIMVNGLQLVT